MRRKSRRGRVEVERDGWSGNGNRNGRWVMRESAKMLCVWKGEEDGGETVEWRGAYCDAGAVQAQVPTDCTVASSVIKLARASDGDGGGREQQQRPKEVAMEVGEERTFLVLATPPCR